MSIRSKISKIQHDLKKINNDGLMEFAVIYMGNSSWREHEAKAVRKHIEKHGDLTRLRIVRTMVPPVAPPPSDEALALVHGSGNSAY